MRIEQIEAFLAVCETGNFGLAAKKLRLTQSTVSRQIQALENHLGISLFHRQAKAKLTIAGERLLPHARKICGEWDRVEASIKELIGGKQVELCVAAIHSVCAHYLPPILQKFSQTHPQVQLRVTALGSDRALKVLRDGLVDVVLVMDNRHLTTSPEMVVKPLYREPILLLMSANHPLTAAPQLTVNDLSDYPHAVFKDGYGMHRVVREYFSQGQKKPAIAMELNTLDAFRGVVRQGNLIALLPQSALYEARRDPSLAVRPVGMELDSVAESPLTREVVLATTCDRLAVPTIASFFELAYNYAEEYRSHLSQPDVI